VEAAALAVPEGQVMTAVGREWAVVGLVIWLISLDTCLVCEAEPEFIDVGYSLHESARGTTERPSR
jgi:type IV secretory pathway TrbD component